MMKQFNIIKIMALSVVLVNTYMHSAGVQLQETSIHPIWYSVKAGKQLSRTEKVNKYRTICDQLGGTENVKIPKKTGVRIASYNVHYWRNPYSNFNTKDLPGFPNYEVDKIIEVIKAVNADILILQEVGGKEQEKWGSVKKVIEGELQYKYVACASTSPQGVDKEWTLYNCIYSKYPFVGDTIQKQYTINPGPKAANPEQRCFVGAHIQLPGNKTISVYGTHLEVRPIVTASGRSLSPDTARKEQIQELLEYIKNNDKNDNVVIGADFNTFRKQDLLDFNIAGTTLWSLMERDWPNILKETAHEAKGLEHLMDKTPTTMALDYVAAQGYKDSFTRGGFTAPQFSVWTGTLIDFLFLSPKWNLGISGSYVFYNWASDHIPLIMDIGGAAKPAGKTPVTGQKTTPTKPVNKTTSTAAKKATTQTLQGFMKKNK